MKKDNIHRSKFSIVLLVSALFFLFIFSQCDTIGEYNASIDATTTRLQKLKTNGSKQKGVHLFGELDSLNLQPFIQNNFEWITLVSWASQKDFDSETLRYFRGDSLARIRRDSMWKSEIDLLHANGFKVFLKPHLWLHEPTDGKWRSDVYPTNEENWQQWQKKYRDFILHYAKIAEQNEVELFCVGTEFTKLTAKKPDFWKSLIQEVRSVYSGELTYAANWYNEFEKITFWEDLDYIGVQAYFPLVKNKYPTVEQISKGWDKYLSDLASVHKKYDRKILFTEMGYKSTADSAISPWEWVENTSMENQLLSSETQAHCYEAFFDKVWNQEWFAGVHIWQMRSDFVKGRGYSDFNFTPQGKPAEAIITKAFE